MRAAIVIAHKEAGELLRSMRGPAWLLAVTAALSVFGLLLVSNTELSLLDNAQVVYDMVCIVTALGALLGLVAGIDTVAGERERGSLVPLLLTPVSRDAILAGKLGGIASAWAVLYLLALPYLWAVGSTGQNLWAGMLVLTLVGSPVVLGFGFFGIGLGALLASSRAGLLTGLITILVSACPLVLGPSLRQSAVGRAFDAVNPLSAATNAYDAVIIDSQAILAQWPHAVVAAIWLVLTIWLARSGFRRVVRLGEIIMKFAAVLVALGISLSATGASAESLSVDIRPDTGNPASPQMGDNLSFHTVIRNGGSVPVRGLIAWISLLQTDAGKEQPVDLEDWSAHKAVTASTLAPGQSLETAWPVRLIQAGHYRVVVSAAGRNSGGLVTSPFDDFVVRQKPVVESHRVLPIVLGMPLLIGAAMVLRRWRA